MLNKSTKNTFYGKIIKIKKIVWSLRIICYKNFFFFKCVVLKMWIRKVRLKFSLLKKKNIWSRKSFFTPKLYIVAQKLSLMNLWRCYLSFFSKKNFWSNPKGDPSGDHFIGRGNFGNLVSKYPKPNYLTLLLKETQKNTFYRKFYKINQIVRSLRVIF